MPLVYAGKYTPTPVKVRFNGNHDRIIMALFKAKHATQFCANGMHISECPQCKRQWNIFCHEAVYFTFSRTTICMLPIAHFQLLRKQVLCIKHIVMAVRTGSRGSWSVAYVYQVHVIGTCCVPCAAHNDLVTTIEYILCETLWCTYIMVHARKMSRFVWLRLAGGDIISPKTHRITN